MGGWVAGFCWNKGNLSPAGTGAWLSLAKAEGHFLLLKIIIVILIHNPNINYNLNRTVTLVAFKYYVSMFSQHCQHSLRLPPP